MKEKLLAALKMSHNPKYKQAAEQRERMDKIASVTVVWTQAGFEKEMAKRRYVR